MSTSTSERATASPRQPRAFRRGVAAVGLPNQPASTDPVTDAGLAPLPPVAARYLRAVGG